MQEHLPSGQGAVPGLTRLPEHIFLSIGSNLGDSAHIIVSALQSIASEYRIRGMSALYTSSPQDYAEQKDFLNCVVSLEIPQSASPYSVLQSMQDIELRFGRNREHEIPKGPRTLDIDIIFYAQKQLNTKKLYIPYHSYRRRKFVLLPLLEMDPLLTDPQTKIPLQKYYDRVQNDPLQAVHKIQNTKYNTLYSQYTLKNKQEQN